jgi:hypothetical protein
MTVQTQGIYDLSDLRRLIDQADHLWVSLPELADVLDGIDLPALRALARLDHDEVRAIQRAVDYLAAPTARSLTRID